MNKFHLLMLSALALFSSCSTPVKQNPDRFVRVENGKFYIDQKPYYYIGTNFWFGAILGSEGQGGNRERLLQELDFMKSKGINNLRVLVGSDGERGILTKVEPTLQTAPGVYNDTIFAGLDYLLDEMGKRDMYAVLYLNNSWEWSGGYGKYLQWAENCTLPNPAIDGYPAFMEFVSQFPCNDKAKALFAQYVRDVIGRTNRYNNLAYKDDPTIMSWQIGNEPRAFSDDSKAPFEKWMGETAALIKELDPNHLVSTGSEGMWGCEMDLDLWDRIHSDKNVDYANIHIWPYNWSWLKPDSMQQSLAYAKEMTDEYIAKHTERTRRMNKPLVLEEFGLPRDGMLFASGTNTTCRDEYYEFIFDKIVSSAKGEGGLNGCNFWAWGGFAQPRHEMWQVGDDYVGDPAQEAQGLNSVFSDDATVTIIQKKASEL